jgi:hypothetical protein
MTITKEQHDKMVNLAKPLIEWMNENCNPHNKIILDCASVELLSGVAASPVHDFLKD